MREDLVQSAVSFLTDPKVQSASLAKKVSFLESKGMTSEEIEEAMSRSNGNASNVIAAAPTAAVAGTVAPGGMVPYNAAAATPALPPPVPTRPQYDWRDLFIAAVVASGAGYGLWTLAKRFFGPWFKVPSKEQLEKDKDALDAQFQAVEESLKEIKDQTEEALTTVSDQSEKVNASLVSIEGALQELKKGDDARQTEFGKVRDEVDGLKEIVPQLIERNKQEQNLVLESLQTELKSLKNLLLSRRPSTSTASGTAAGNSPLSAAAAAPSAIENKLAAATLPSSTTSGNGSNSNRGIPAWQMASAASGNKPAGSSEQQQPGPANESTTSSQSENATPTTEAT